MQILKKARELIEAEYNFKGDVEKLRARLRKEWYRDLDEEVYQNPAHLWEVYHCYADWTKVAVRAAIRKGAFDKCHTIVDFFGGIGLAAIDYKEAYPDKAVYLHTTSKIELKIARKLVKGTGVQVISNIRKLKDLKGKIGVSALEIFEHFQDPINITQKLLFDYIDPQVLVECSSFTVESIGHWPTYIYNDMSIDNKKVARLFHKYIREQGFEVTDRGWNNRPIIWDQL